MSNKNVGLINNFHKLFIDASRKIMKKIYIKLIRLYQKHISAAIPARCRYTPTCSAYAITAINRFGVIRGGLLAFYRILRCNPFGSYGYDPVPEKFTFKRQFPKPPRKF